MINWKKHSLKNKGDFPPFSKQGEVVHSQVMVAHGEYQESRLPLWPSNNIKRSKGSNLSPSVFPKRILKLPQASELCLLWTPSKGSWFILLCLQNATISRCSWGCCSRGKVLPLPPPTPSVVLHKQGLWGLYWDYFLNHFAVPIRFLSTLRALLLLRFLPAIQSVL